MDVRETSYSISNDLAERIAPSGKQRSSIIQIAIY